MHPLSQHSGDEIVEPGVEPPVTPGGGGDTPGGSDTGSSEDGESGDVLIFVGIGAAGLLAVAFVLMRRNGGGNQQMQMQMQNPGGYGNGGPQAMNPSYGKSY